MCKEDMDFQRFKIKLQYANAISTTPKIVGNGFDIVVIHSKTIYLNLFAYFEIQLI